MSFRKIQTSNLASVSTVFDDPIIVINNKGTLDNKDVGILAKTTANAYTGLFRDGTTKDYYLVEQYVQDISNNDLIPGQATLSDLHLANLTASGITMSGSIIPDTDIAYDLGSPTKQWRGIYVDTPTSAMHAANKNYVDNAISGIVVTTDLASLTDVTLTTPTNGQVLVYDSVNNIWVNSDSPQGFDGAYSSLTGTPTIPSDVSDLTDTTGLLTHFDGDYNSLTSLPVLFDGQYSSLTGLPTLFSGSYTDLTNKPTIPTVPTTVSSFTNDAGYLTSYTETDPVFTASAASGIVSGDITNWNTAFGWGNHATAGYLTSVPSHTLADATDVDTTGAVNGSVLKYNGTSWVIGTDDTGTTINNIDDIGDVVITSPSSGQVLKYNGTNWVNDTDATADAGTGGSWGSITGTLSDQTDLQTELDTFALSRDMKLENGYNNRDATLVTFTEATRTFTIEPAPGHSYFEVWAEGVYHKITTQKSIVIPDVEGSHYIYFDGTGELGQTSTYDSHLMLAIYAYTSAVYWDAENKKAVYLGNEQHGRADLEMHEYLHDCVGTQWVYGLGLYNMTVGGDGSSDTHMQIAVQDGKIRDEDIPHNIISGVTHPQILNSVAQIPLFYRSGTSGHWRKIEPTGLMAHVQSGQSLPSWNEWTGSTWQLTECGNKDYILTHIFATGDRRHPIVGVIGQQTYTTSPTAQAGATSEIGTLSHGAMDEAFEEFKALGTLLIYAASNYSNTTKSVIVQPEAGVDYIDWRDNIGGNAGTAGVSINDHGQLVGLSDDDHPQYLRSDGLRQLSGHLLPDTDITYDLGSATNRFRDLYLSSATIYLGENSLSVDQTDNTLKVSGKKVVTDDNIGNVVREAVNSDPTIIPSAGRKTSKTEVGWSDWTAEISSEKSPSAYAPVKTSFGPDSTHIEHAFDVDDYAFTTAFRVGHDIDPGAEVYFHVHWSTSGTDTAPVVWELTISGALAHSQESFPSSTTFTMSGTPNGTAWTHYETSVSAADVITLVEPDALMLIRIRRLTNGGTDNKDDVFGLHVGAHYQTSRFNTPNRLPNFY